MQDRAGDTPPEDVGLRLSVCVTCRDGREKTWEAGVRAGSRFADAIEARLAERKDDLPPVSLNRTCCMSQCDRPCAVALSAPEFFICIFAGLDMDRQVDDVLDMVAAYAEGQEAFLACARRLDPARTDRLRFLNFGKPA